MPLPPPPATLAEAPISDGATDEAVVSQRFPGTFDWLQDRSATAKYASPTCSKAPRTPELGQPTRQSTLLQDNTKDSRSGTTVTVHLRSNTALRNHDKHADCHKRDAHTTGLVDPDIAHATHATLQEQAQTIRSLY